METTKLYGLCAQRLHEMKHPNVSYQVLTKDYVRLIVKASQGTQQFTIPVDAVGKYCIYCKELVTYNNTEMHASSDDHNYMCYKYHETITCTDCNQDISVNNLRDIVIHNSQCTQQFEVPKNVEYCIWCKIQIPFDTVSDFRRHYDSKYHSECEKWCQPDEDYILAIT
jgi:hypothetical protein